MADNKESSSAANELLGAHAQVSDQSGLPPRSRIGVYVIRHVLGEGGTGQVYLAAQLQPVQREVALKLSPVHLTSPLSRAYFEVERQASAQMQYTCIAQVFDAGSSESGQACIAMEWVQGEPITCYCVHNNRTMPARLRLFQRVCRGVQHAHQKGVIHRHLKPDNMLVRKVDGVAQQKIIDFGIAIGRTIDSANELAINLLRQKKFAEVEKLLQHYLPIATRLYGVDHSVRMRLFSNLGGAIRQQRRNKEAKPYYEDVLEWSLKAYGSDSAQTVFAQSNLGFLLRDAGNLAEAEQHARQAVAHMDVALGGDNGTRGQQLSLLGTILTLQKKYPEAAATLDRAWIIYTTGSGYGPDHPLAQDTVEHQIELYRAWNNPAEVELWQARLQPSPDKADHA